jgi:hypothetical protein
MISQYFIGALPFSSPDEFPTPRNLSANVVGLNDLLARVSHRAIEIESEDSPNMKHLRKSGLSDL